MRRVPNTRAVSIVLMTTGFILLGWGLYIPAKVALAQVLLERAWVATPPGEAAPSPWPWADTRPLARIRTVDRQHSAIILAGAHGRSLAFGPGHIDGTALPGGIGHSVVAAHRDTHFAFLRDVKIGQRIIVERPGRRARPHVVVDMQIIDARSETILIDHDTDMLTLVTCYPFEDWNPDGPLRYVVHAVAIGADDV